MQATFEQHRSYEISNNFWNNPRQVTQSQASFYSSFNSFNPRFNAAPARSMNPFTAPREFNQPSVYPQMSRGMGSFHPYAPQQASFSSAQRGASMTRYDQEISRTPNGTRMKTSYTSFQQPGSKGRDCLPGPSNRDCVPNHSPRDFCDDRYRTGNDRNKVTPVVSQNGGKLNVDMAGTHSELFKDQATTRMKVGGNDIEFTGWGDPHGILKVNGQESKADFSKPLSLDAGNMRVTMDPERKASSGSVPPHMDRVIYEPKGTQQVFVGEHLSPSDSSQVSFREDTDRREKADLRQTANNAQKAASAGDKIIDQKTGQKIV